MCTLQDMHSCVCVCVCLCVLFVHYLYRLPCPTIDPRGISSALFGSDAAALGSSAARRCVVTLSPMLRLAVHSELINLLVSGRSANSNEMFFVFFYLIEFLQSVSKWADVT